MSKTYINRNKNICGYCGFVKCKCYYDCNGNLVIKKMSKKVDREFLKELKGGLKE